MKRDMDLIRQILLAVETHDHGFFQDAMTIDGYSNDLVKFHCHLIGEAGLGIVVPDTALHDKSPQALITQLTWQGYEFLDAARNDTIWKAAKTRISTAIGSVSFAVLTQVLIDAAKQQLGMKQ